MLGPLSVETLGTSGIIMGPWEGDGEEVATDTGEVAEGSSDPDEKVKVDSEGEVVEVEVGDASERKISRHGE